MILETPLTFTEGSESRYEVVAYPSVLASVRSASSEDLSSGGSLLASGRLGPGQRTVRVAELGARRVGGTGWGSLASDGGGRLEVESRVYFCDARTSACRVDNALFIVPVDAAVGGGRNIPPPPTARLVQAIAAPALK